MRDNSLLIVVAAGVLVLTGWGTTAENATESAAASARTTATDAAAVWAVTQKLAVETAGEVTDLATDLGGWWDRVVAEAEARGVSLPTFATEARTTIETALAETAARLDEAAVSPQADGERLIDEARTALADAAQTLADLAARAKAFDIGDEARAVLDEVTGRFADLTSKVEELAADG